jgi:spermidine synthase
MMSRSAMRMLFACFLLAFCSLSYEFMAAQIMASVMGNTVLLYSLTMGVYIFALGMGSLIPVADISQKILFHRLLYIELGLCLLGGLAPFWILTADGGIGQLPLDSGLQTWLSLGFCFILITAIGMLSGMELPLLLRLDEIRYQGREFMRLLAIDYIASFAGALAFPLWIFPSWGLVQAAALFGLFNVLATLLLIPRAQIRPLQWYVLAIGLGLGLIFWQADATSQWMSRQIYARTLPR